MKEYSSWLPFRQHFEGFECFTSALLHTANHFADKLALIEPDTGKQRSFSELCSEVRMCCSQLAGLGLRKGSRVATICGNSIDYLVFCLAAAKLGLVTVPINAACKRHEIVTCVQGCNVTSVVVSQTELARISLIMKEEQVDARLIVLENVSGEDGAENHDQSTVQRKDTAFIFFSSGTTGAPKAIRHSHRALISTLEQTLSVVQSDVHAEYEFPTVTSDDVVHGVLPYFHAGGLITVFCMLVKGATVVVNKKWNANNFHNVLSQYKVTAVNIVPPILSFFATIPPSSLPHLRTIFVGAAKCDLNLMNTISTKFPNIELVQLFGMTEAGVLLLMTPRHNTKLRSVGLPLPGVTITVADSGEMSVCSVSMMQGYLESEKDMSTDSWYDTGDVVSLDEEGFVYIESRTKDMIKVRGWQVNPYELEEAIKGLESVEDCAVVGIECPVNGQLPKAFVVGTITSGEVQQFVEDNFVSYKRLSSVEFVTSLPRTASGKIQRQRLLESSETNDEKIV